jgi:glycogen operon protein
LNFRAANPALRPADFYKGRDRNHNGLKDVTWYSAEGTELRPKNFDSTGGFLAYRLDATEFEGHSPVRSIYVAMNADFDKVNVRLPAPAPGHAWFRVADTAAWFEAEGNFHPPGQEAQLKRDYEMHSRCELLLIEKPISRK